MKIEVGEMPCSNEDCKSHDLKRPVTLFLNDETGGLIGVCDKCGMQHIGKVGQAVRESWIKRHCAANEATIRAAEKRGGKPGKGTDPASPVAAAPAGGKSSEKTEQTKEGGIWRR